MSNKKDITDIVILPLCDNNKYPLQWISVKQLLPKEDEYVLVYKRYEGIQVGFLEKGHWWDFRDYREIECEYWMPLPEPPKYNEL